MIRLLIGALCAIITVASAQRIQNPLRPIQCFACVSDQSRVMFDRDGQQGGQQRSFDVCDDPFQPGSQLLQPCQTSCVKSVTENQFTRVVLRGCLTDVAQQLTGRNPNMVIPSPGTCTENTVNTPNVGRVTTRTCICDTQACNGSSMVAISGLLLFATSALLAYLF